MGPVPPCVARQAELLRLFGNAAFRKERIGAAIDAYTEAIALCPDVAVYWTNRALCYRKRKEWIRVEEDCRRALQLDNRSVKSFAAFIGQPWQYLDILSSTFPFLAYYMLGLSLLERQDCARGIKELEKALELGRVADPLGYMIEEIWQVLAEARYKEWENLSCIRAWKLQNLKEACEKALMEHYFLESSDNVDESKRVSIDHSEQLDFLSEVFSKAAEADTPTEVPDYLCCKITLDILRDPVVTPSGMTYERTVILEHLRKVGKFDPITRVPLVECQLVPNTAIKQAVRAYLAEHGWAYKTS